MKTMSSLPKKPSLSELYGELIQSQLPQPLADYAQYLIEGELEQLNNTLWTGEAAAGLVQVKVNHDGHIVKTIVEMKGEKENEELLADCFTGAYHNALMKLEENVKQRMYSIQKKMQDFLKEQMRNKGDKK